MATKNRKKSDYNEDSIEVKEFPDNVRTRPTMYIGQIGIAGNNHLVKEVVDNSTDEAMNGFGDTIIVELSNKKGMCRVKDEGRGIPPKAIEKAFTKLHSSGKFNNNEYSVAGGLNGVGTTAVNGLSTHFNVTTHRDGKEYTQTFEKGIKTTELSKGKPSKLKGTTVEFYPDEDIMESHEFDFNYLGNELDMKAYVNGGIKYIIKNLDTKKSIEYFHKNGLKDYVPTLGKNLIHTPVIFSDSIEVTKRKKKIKIEVTIALAWQKEGNEITKSFCNSLYTSEDGTHVTGFKLAIVNIMKKYIADENILTKKDQNLDISGDDVRNGLIAAISVRHPEPLYDSQTKAKVTNSELQGAVQKVVNAQMSDWLRDNPKLARQICNKIILSAKASEAARKAKEMTTKKGSGSLGIISDLSKLAGCNSKNPEERELFIVEGNSAGGTAKDCRDKMFQAIYALRGKPLNTNNMDVVKIFTNKEFADLTFILTGERDCLDEKFDISKLKYHTIIIMADADSDGKHIVCLLLSFFYHHMPGLIEAGHVKVAMPPLYSILVNKKRHYFLDDEEYNSYINNVIEKKFTFKVNKKNVKNVTALMKDLGKYAERLRYYEEHFGINRYLIEEVAIYIQDDTTKKIGSFVKKLGDFIVKDKSEISGLYKDSFITVDIKQLKKYAKDFVDYVSTLKYVTFDTVITKTDNGDSMGSLCEAYSGIYEIAIPKSRVRLKGLGEMDADELWETTMNPEKRNIMIAQVDDNDTVNSTMEDMLNSNATDKRKAFLFKNQEKAKHLNI